MPGSRVAAVRLAHSESGPAGATPVILLHGSPTDRRIWAPQAADLAAAGFRVVRPDLRGHGASPLGEGPSTVEAMAADVWAMADELAIAGFVLGGLSFGGWVAMEMVRERPERILGLVLADTGAQPDTPKERAARPEQAARIRREGLQVDAYRERLLTEATLKERPDVWAAARASMAAVSAEGRARAVEGMAARPDFRPTLSKLKLPALVIVGAEDPVTPPALAREIHALIRGSFLQEVEGASHLSTLEAPGVVSQAILNWMAFEGLGL